MASIENFQTRFTALGLSGSGKTCYVMGMYSEMASGIRGWTIRTANADADRIARQLRVMENTTGGDRFPAGTQDYVFDDYEFELYFRNQKIMNFNWADYAGAILEDSGLNYETLGLLEDSILCSTTLYIFVDGELLCDGTTKEKIKRVRRNCADAINPRITNFMKNHEGAIPPVVFVITKSDLCQKFTRLDEMKEILKECFSSIFYDENALAYITAISLGEEIAEDDYSGEVEPVNIQTPFFIGIAHDFARCCAELMEEIEADDRRRRDAISASEQAIQEDEADIRQSERNITGNQEEIARKQRENADKRYAIERRKREIADLKAEASRKEADIRSENSHIDDLSTGAWIFNFVKRAINKSEIEEARANIRRYEQQKNEANSGASDRENWNRGDEIDIQSNQNAIKDAEEDTRRQQQNIAAGKIDIEKQLEIIAQAEENIEKNTKKREKYSELLSDVLSELKKQNEDNQFVVIKGSREMKFDPDSMAVPV